MGDPSTIGQLARTTGVPAKTIRYYEQAGVLPAARRTASGYRQYSRQDVDHLQFVRRARALGVSLADLKVLTAEVEREQCVSLRPRLLLLVTEQLRRVRQQIGEFQTLERQLAQVLQRLQTATPVPDANGCRCLDGTRVD